MNKIIKRDIGWGNNDFSDEVFNESNNNWFILDTDTIYDMLNIDDEDDEDEIYGIKVEKLKQDSRIIYNDDLDSFIVNQKNVDDIEQEYEIEFNSIIHMLDISYGDWEQDYNDIGVEIGIGEHEAYELVRENIVEILETIALQINDMTEEQIKEISCDDITFIEYGLFFKLVYENIEENLKSLKDKYKEFIN